MKTKRTMNKLFAILLSFVILVGLTPLTVFAAENTVDTWDGTADTSWYDVNPDATEYHITSAEELAGLAQIVNTGEGKDFAGKTFYLDNNLDLSGHEWTAIGDSVDVNDPSFYGNFDGQGYEIKNIMTTTEKEHSQLGLFGGVTGGTISNLHVTNANIVNTNELYAGILAGQTYRATIKNCSVSGTLKASPLGGSYIGGLIGFAHSSTKVIGCSSSATIIDYVTQWTGHAIGGVVGVWVHNDDQNGLISDCYFDGKIVFSEDSDEEIGKDGLTGGILGYHYTSYGTGDITINNCMVATTQIENAYTKSEEGNSPVWIMRNAETSAPQNCYWPTHTGNWSAAVIDMKNNSQVINNCGHSIGDFKDDALLIELQKNAAGGVKWVEGVNHPTFSWDEKNITADYSKVDEAIEKAEALNKEQYKDFSAVETAINAVIRDKNITEQATVDSYATDIENAIAALKYKDADYSKVDEAIEKAEALNKEQYKDFSAVETAINAVVRGKNITEQGDVDAMAKAINDAISSLEKKTNSNNSDIPQTGDTVKVGMWAALLLASCGAVIGTTVYNKKKNSRGC